jgi:hypothetical protein
MQLYHPDTAYIASHLHILHSKALDELREHALQQPFDIRQTPAVNRRVNMPVHTRAHGVPLMSVVKQLQTIAHAYRTGSDSIVDQDSAEDIGPSQLEI